MQKLRCPSCGGQLELSENLEIAHCMYCGTKTLLQEQDISKERLDIVFYKELSNNALLAENYNEAIQYCNKVLKIVPKDVDSWINKALATFWVTPNKPGYDEAMEYLNKAADLSPNDERIKAVEQELIHHQLEFLSHMGSRKFFDGAGDRQFPAHLYHGTFYDIERTEASEYLFIEAMDYHLKGLELSPGNPIILKSIKHLILEVPWIEWSDSVLSKAQLTEEIDSIKEIAKQIRKLRNEQKELDSKTGILFNRRTGDDDRRIVSISAEIRELEMSVLGGGTIRMKGPLFQNAEIIKPMDYPESNSG